MRALQQVSAAAAAGGGAASAAAAGNGAAAASAASGISTAASAASAFDNRQWVNSSQLYNQVARFYYQSTIQWAQQGNFRKANSAASAAATAASGAAAASAASGNSAGGHLLYGSSVCCAQASAYPEELNAGPQRTSLVTPMATFVWSTELLH